MKGRIENMEGLIKKANILIEALPYIRELYKKLQLYEIFYNLIRR